MLNMLHFYDAYYQEWTDKRLVWNPRKFYDIAGTYVPSDKIWKPDIVLMNK